MWPIWGVMRAKRTAKLRIRHPQITWPDVSPLLTGRFVSQIFLNSHWEEIHTRSNTKREANSRKSPALALGFRCSPTYDPIGTKITVSNATARKLISHIQ